MVSLTCVFNSRAKTGRAIVQSVCVCVCFRLVWVVTSWSCRCSTKEASWWPASTWLSESSHRSSCTPSGSASVSQVTYRGTASNGRAPFRFYEYGVFVPEGLSSFYSELMKGFGAGARLWELLDRKPEFPLNGKHTYTKITLTKPWWCNQEACLTQYFSSSDSQQRV